MTGKELIARLDSSGAKESLLPLYGSEGLETAKRRYAGLIEGLLNNSAAGFPQNEFPETAGDLRLFSSPGRTELLGNHTDHNQGKVLAASIQLDVAAAAAPRKDKQVFFRSAGHRDVKLDISRLSMRNEEKGETEALIRGIAAEFEKRGTPVGGFTANAASSVLTGSGLSSSAAIELLFAKIFDNLYGSGERGALELAQIGQNAENHYFGKPSGLMDQTACASGGVVAIDFGDRNFPAVKNINFDPLVAGFALCVVNTKGSHADLTPEYASVPSEMKSVAAFFGKDVLRAVDEKAVTDSAAALRGALGDRAVLRALHFFGENRRVDSMLAAIENINALPECEKSGAMERILSLVNESGDSSWELLQNVYAPKKPEEQGLSLALALSRNFMRGGNSEALRRGACRVHGGGFAGTVQIYLPVERLPEYRLLAESVFGEGALTVLKIRRTGTTELNFA